ncbi:MAG: alpha/beta fold hydrolase [Atopobiaceae bacterium]|jgi:fermentation-respiration switch protein FrsA (DUF1100 family)|nr:alpha/beta fold hydrolase [Atopobiaceae bacterium]
MADKDVPGTDDTAGDIDDRLEDIEHQIDDVQGAELDEEVAEQIDEGLGREPKAEPSDARGTEAAGSPDASTPPDDMPASRIPPLPRFADTEGASWEQPTWKHIANLACFVVAMLLIAVVAGVFGSPVAGVIIAIVSIAIVVAMYVQSRTFVAKALAPHRDPILTPSEQKALDGDDPAAALEARKVLRLGRLVMGGTGSPMSGFSGALDPDEAKVIEDNQSREADASWEWVCDLPEPEEVSTTSDDGCRLVGHVMAVNPDSRRWVLIAHGYNGVWNEGMLYARHYAEHGFNLLFVEMRAHGKSEGELIGMGLPDRRDLVAWAQWLVAQEGDDVQVVFHGHSMGGASVCLANGEQDLPSQVKAVVSDCGYSDLWNVLIGIMAPATRVPIHPLVDLMRVALRSLPGGYDIADVSPERALAQAKAPTLIIHGDCDTFVPPYMAKRLGDACGGAAAGAGHEVLMVRHAGHCQSSFADPQTYFSHIFFFLDRYL